MPAPDVGIVISVSAEILGLLGISAGTTVIAKGVARRKAQAGTTAAEPPGPEVTAQAQPATTTGPLEGQKVFMLQTLPAEPDGTASGGGREFSATLHAGSAVVRLSGTIQPLTDSYASQVDLRRGINLTVPSVSSRTQ